MPRRVLLGALISLAFLGGGYLYWRSSRATPPSVEPAETAKVAPPLATPPTAAAPTPAAPEPGPASAPVRRRAPAPKPESPAAAVAVAPTTATLHIDSDIPGAQVFIDRRFAGVTPLTESDVAPGTHRINLVAAGHESLAENVDVVPGPRDLMFKFKEIRLDATIAVVHKHRMGSCKGQLVATPGGLRYETTDKDDTFSIPLGDFETFEVDYLGKVLKLRPRKGKRYEFADPEANADRLFVFHRDVDKVRQRLIQTP